jgi:WD40 repeat protein
MRIFIVIFTVILFTQTCKGQYNGVAFHPMKGIAKISEDNLVITEEGKSVTVPLKDKDFDGSVSLQWSSDASRLVLGTNKKIIVYDAENAYKEVCVLEGKGSFPDPALSEDGKNLALESNSDDIQIFRENKGITQTLRGVGFLRKFMVFSTDSKKLLVESRAERNLQLWDLETGKNLWKTKAYGETGISAFAPNDTIVNCSAHGRLFILDANNGKVIMEEQAFDFNYPSVSTLEHMLCAEDGSVAIVYLRRHWEKSNLKRSKGRVFIFGLLLNSNQSMDPFGSLLLNSDQSMDLVADGYTIQHWIKNDNQLTLKQSTDVDSVVNLTMKDGAVWYHPSWDQSMVPLVK